MPIILSIALELQYIEQFCVLQEFRPSFGQQLFFATSSNLDLNMHLLSVTYFSQI